MVAEAANAYVSILRGTGYDGYGDVIDSSAEVATGIPAILIETVSSVMDPVSQQPRTVRSSMLKLPHWAKLLNTDQIRDDVTGNTYAVIEVTQPPVLTNMAIGGPPDLQVTLRRVTAAGT